MHSRGGDASRAVAGVLLRRARRRREWTQAELARRVGIPASQLCACRRPPRCGRPKDWVDIGEMVAYGHVDLQDARSWLTHLVGSDDKRVARLDALA